MQGQIVNEGTLKIESGTTVYFGDDYTNKSTATHTNEGDLHLVGNFTNDGTTSVPTSGTTYFDSTTNATQNIDGSSNEIHFYNLTVNNTTTGVQGLAVSDLYDLEVENDLVLTSGNLRLIDEAQLIQTHTGLSNNSGLGHLLKDQDGAQNSYRYNYWSSPVRNYGAENTAKFNVNTVLKDGTTPNLFSPTQVGFTAALDGNQNSPIELSTRWLWKYTDGNVDPYNDDGWTSLFILGGTNPSTGKDMLPGEGFCMKGTNPAAVYADQQNYSFEGLPNDGTYSLVISADKEYLVGNPYPSALDANEFIKNHTSDLEAGSEIIDGTIYYWEHWSTNTHYYTSYGAGYALYTLSGGTKATLHGDFIYGSGTGSIEPQQYIPVGQGFIVRSDFTSGGTITFKNEQRTFMLEGTNSIPVKNTNQVTARIRLGYEGPNERHRHLLHAFTDDSATDGFDYGYDGQMIDVGPNDMFFIIEDDDSEYSPYTIQGVGSYNIDAEYPLTVKTATSGSHRIMIDDLEDFDEPLYIMDEKGNTHDLRENDYLFFSESNQTQRDLKLVFKPNSPTAIQNYLHDFVSAFYANDEIIIRNTKEVTLTGLQVYNSLGQLVYQISDAGRLAGDEIHIPFVNYAQTAYVLKLQAEMGNGTYKFINY